ncbi:MAG: HTTM domain-containing protein [Candidatus Obscuribacterales bacterium]|nr:HTTM domain-containing protein [Candidatus Obscuribacterales bacterium]
MSQPLWKLWNDVWFVPKSPLPMAVYRILFGLLVIWDLVLLWPNLETYFGPNGLVTWTTASQYLQPYAFTALQFLPETNQWLSGFVVVVMVAAISLTLGFFTRLSACIVLLGLISLGNRNPLIWNSGDTLLRLGAYYLIFSNAGKALALDGLIHKLIRKRRDDAQEWSPWAQRLLQFQVVLIYFCAFWSKAAGEFWLNGTAVYFVLHFQEFTRVPISLISDNLWLCKLLTWYALVAEASMFTLIWFRKLRYFVLASIALMHLGIELTMNIPIFEWLMIASLVVFVYPEDLQKVLNRVGLGNRG